MPGMCLLPFSHRLWCHLGAMGRAEPRDVAFNYSTASLPRIFIVALFWASREGTGPASSHSFTLYQDSIVTSPLTSAGSCCPKPPTINRAQYISSLSLQPSLCLCTWPVSWFWSMQGYCQVSSVFWYEQSAQAGFTPWLRQLPTLSSPPFVSNSK